MGARGKVPLYTKLVKHYASLITNLTHTLHHLQAALWHVAASEHITCHSVTGSEHLSLTGSDATLKWCNGNSFLMAVIILPTLLALTSNYLVRIIAR